MVAAAPATPVAWKVTGLPDNVPAVAVSVFSPAVALSVQEVRAAIPSALTSWTLSATAGENTLTATAGTLSGSPVTFHATGVAGAAATMANHSPTTQSAPAGTAVASPPSVIVTDANGNPVSGVEVTFATGLNSGAVDPATPVATGTDGVATVTSW